MASSHAFEMDNDASTPTPIALPQDDDSDESDDLGPPQAPFGQGQQLRGKASYDSLSSNRTTRSQVSQDPRPAKEIRKPSGGTAGDGLRGFQFPLSKAVMASRPPPLTRNASAMPLSSAAEDENSSLSPSRPGLQSMQSAMPDLQPNSATAPVKPARPQISINLPPRPPMMRHASAAVMEGRAQAQAQAQALAVVDTGAKNLGVPGKPQIGLGVGVPGQVGMSRSRSGSRTEDHSVGLRDLMRVSLCFSDLKRFRLMVAFTCSPWFIRSSTITVNNRKPNAQTPPTASRTRTAITTRIPVSTTPNIPLFPRPNAATSADHTRPEFDAYGTINLSSLYVLSRTGSDDCTSLTTVGCGYCRSEYQTTGYDDGP